MPPSSELSGSAARCTLLLGAAFAILLSCGAHALGTRTQTQTLQTVDDCADGWTALGEHCYRYFAIKDHRPNETLPTAMTFFDALDFCGEHQATIIPIQNMAQYKFLQDMIGKNSGRKFWNGVYQDSRYTTRVWRTVYNRSHFNDFFVWDKVRRMPQHEDCIVVHNFGDLSKRVVGGNGAMITYPCDSRAEVVCVRRRDPWSVTAVNLTTSGAVLAVEGQPLTLTVVGRRLPALMSLQLQTTTYATHNGEEGAPTQCVQTKPRNPILFNVSQPAIATNVSVWYSFIPLCNGTCNRAVLKFPPSLKLERGHRYSLCFFLPYDWSVPTSSDEFRWNFLPSVWIEVAESRVNYYKETCARHKQLVSIFLGNNDTDTNRQMLVDPAPFDGPIQPLNYEYKEGIKP